MQTLSLLFAIWSCQYGMLMSEKNANIKALLILF